MNRSRATMIVSTLLVLAVGAWIARNTVPMFVLMAAAVLLIWFVPELVTFLPRQMKMG